MRGRAEFRNALHIRRWDDDRDPRADYACRVLMANGKWKVPEAERPALAPEPQERERVQRYITEHR